MGIYDPINYRAEKSAKPPRFSFTPDMPSAPKPIQPEILEPLKPPKFAEAPPKGEFTAKRTVDVKPVSSNQSEPTTSRTAINIRSVSANQPEPVYDTLLKVGRIGLNLLPPLQVISRVVNAVDLATNSLKPTVSGEDETAAIKRAQDKLLQAGSEPGIEVSPAVQGANFTGGQSAVAYDILISFNYSAYPTDPQEYLVARVLGPIGGVRLFESSPPRSSAGDTLKGIEILCCGYINQSPQPQKWVVVSEGYGYIKSINSFSVRRFDGQPDTGGNLPPTSQATYSSPGTTIASPQTYEREIGDRQPQPLQKQFQIPMLDFAEPLPKLVLIPDLLPVDVAQPDPTVDPEASPVTEPLPLPNPAAVETAPRLGDVTTLFGPSANPGTIKITQPFGGVTPSSLPNSQPLTNTGVDRTPQPAPLPTKTPARTPSPEKTELEKTKEDLERLITGGAALAGLTPAIQAISEKVTQTARQTTPEAIATAAETGTCNAFAPNGCNADIKDNAKKAADNSAGNSDKLNKLTNAADLGLDADTNIRVRNLEDKLGVNEYPLILPEYLLDDFLDKQVIIANQAQYNIWLLKQIDALVGLFPIKIERIDEDGNKQTLVFENIAEAIAELTGLLAQIAFDADTAVNVATRATGEALGAKAASLQAGSYLKAIIDHMGFQTQSTAIDVPVSVTLGAVGLDGKLQESELKDFLKPSTQRVIGIKNTDPVDSRLTLQRILQNTEIARAALYRPLKPKLEENALTGDAIKTEKVEEKKRVDKQWDAFKLRMEKHTGGTKVDIDDGDKDQQP